MDRPSVSIIIPSADGRRSGNLDFLRREIETQTLLSKEVHVIKGVSPTGLARNTGARKASGDVLIFLDDDVRLGHERVLEGMVALLEDPGVGMVGAAQLLPPGSSIFQRLSAGQITRSCSAIVSIVTDSDMVTTACCAMRRSLFWGVGGFNEHIPRGVDPEMRHRVRSRGLRIVAAPNAWFYHPMPATLRALCKMSFRNGHQSAEAQWRMPGAALENPDGHVAGFVIRRNRLYRAGRHAGRFVLGVITMRWISVAAQVSYLAGYLWRGAQDHQVGAPALDPQKEIGQMERPVREESR